MRFGHQVHKIVVAHIVFRQQQHMVQARFVLRAHLGVFGEINLATVNRLDALASLFFHRIACIAQLRNAAHDAVVGDGDSGHVKIGGATNHVLDLGGSVEHGIFGVIVKMNECHCALAPCCLCRVFL